MLPWVRPPPSTVPRSSLLGTATSCVCVSTCARNDREMVCLKGQGRRGGGGGGSNSPFMREMGKET